MASFARRRTPAAAWSVDDASTFAAQKEFKLLQLLSTDKKAFATARRLGLYSTQPQLQQTARSSAAATATSARRRPDAASGRPVGPNSRQKRSAERSARHHAQLQVQFYRTAIAVLYICRLRRMCRARRLQARLADLESLDGEPVSVDSGGPPSSRSCALRESSSKRADRPLSAASSSAATSTSSSGRAALLGGFYHAQCPPVLLQLGGQRKQQRKAAPALPYAGRM